MKRNIATLLMLTLFILPLWSQQLNHVQGEILVMLEAETNVREWTREFEYFEGKKAEFNIHKQISVPMNIWSFTFNHNQINEYRLLDAIWRNSDAKLVQFNHFIKMRSTIPNDIQFGQQWQYINTGQDGGTEGADIDVDLAWDITTGGLTALGDTIVVCVIDNGIDLNHDDFENNLWRNYGEIPDNGVDDDDNGYIDDYQGWSTISDNDDIAGQNHGTAVAGIVGAKGNNEIGVSGVSWDVKVMVVRNGSTLESSVLSAYSYPLTQRRLYNESDGERGAFVVATNASWGIDNGQPEDSPLWCAFYDTLGYAGILSCGATANANVNVDEEGDLPTACSSDYLISVTNMNRNDEKVTGAGYGLTSIDLGAFGSDTWTTSIGNSYGAFGGTSGATPHVAGTIGLLYSAPCTDFSALVKSAPAAAATFIKQVILDGVDANESLDTITVSGGRLNVNNSLQLLMENCGACFPPVALSIENIGLFSVDLNWAQSDSISQIDARWRVIGANDWVELEDVMFPFAIPDLSLCQDYEVQLRGYCGEEILEYTDSYTFKTEGCCEAPTEIELSEITPNSADLQWNSILSATGYIFEYREVGTDLWTMAQSGVTGISLSNLASCTEYEYRITSHCSTDGEVGEVAVFRTTDCGDCADAEYCEPQNLAGAEEWVQSFSLGEFNNESGTDESYGDFTLLGTIELQQNIAYPLHISPGYSGVHYSEDFHLYIDYNHDEEFSEDEIVFELSETFTTPFDSMLHIPVDAPLGLTRMRLVMQATEVDNACPGGFNTYGEVEDYCVEITLIDAVKNIEALDDWTISPNPFFDNIQLKFDFSSPMEALQINVFNQLGRSLLIQNMENIQIGKQMVPLELNQLPSGVYFVSITTPEGKVAVKKVVKME